MAGNKMKGMRQILTGTGFLLSQKTKRMHFLPEKNYSFPRHFLGNLFLRKNPRHRLVFLQNIATCLN